ncbi:hypothetical protein V2J09_017338 [Rumex salicifolius]
MSNSSFKMRHPLESRKAESARFREKYPDIIPLVVEKRSDIPNIDGKIYQITADATYRQFEDYVRKCPVLGPEDAMIIFARSISKLPEKESKMGINVVVGSYAELRNLSVCPTFVSSCGIRA